ncbi:hypothetical protein Vafri_14013, partial [Volvox africanus]
MVTVATAPAATPPLPPVHQTPLPPTPPAERALGARSDSGREGGAGAGTVVAAAEVAGAWQREPQGPVGTAAPGGGLEQISESDIEMGNGGGVNADGIGVQEGGPKGPEERPALAPQEAQPAAMVAVRPVCPYMEYDLYAAGQAPLTSFYSYALTEGLDEDDED